jgi:hypothetical protein
MARKNPEWVADLRWRDLPGLTPVIVATQKDPIAMIETAAKATKPNVKDTPYIAMFADKTPSIPVLDLWCWAFFQYSRGNDEAAKKRASRALRTAAKAGINADQALYAVLAIVESKPSLIDVESMAKESTYKRGVDRKQAFAADVESGRGRGLDLPEISEWDVVETVFYSLEDSVKAAMAELRGR